MANQVMHFIIIFSIYPKTIFTGMIKVVLFTVIPAGLITFMPVELLRDFRWTTWGAVLASAVPDAPGQGLQVGQAQGGENGREIDRPEEQPDLVVTIQNDTD